MKTLTLQMPLDIQAAQPQEGEPVKLARVSFNAYTGALIRQAWSAAPLVIDLAGVSVPSQALPIRYQHEPTALFGHTTHITVSDKGITAEGVNSMPSPLAGQLVESARNGFPWQASVGMDIDEMEEVKANKTAKVNGQTLKGPLMVARKTTLAEISIVDLGADRNTTAAIAASHSRKDSTMADSPSPADVKAEPVATASTLDDVITKHTLEAKRQSTIAAHADRLMAQYPARTEVIAELARTAVAAGHRPEQFEADAYRVVAALPSVSVGRRGGHGVDNSVLEASIARTLKMPNIEKHYPADTLQRSEDIHRNSVGLKQVLGLAAKANGFQGDDFGEEMLQAAFRRKSDIQAAPTSYINIGGILSNVANKFMRDAFNAVEAGWREISAIRSVTDFKAVTSYSLIGAGDYQLVKNGGELKHGQLSEIPYSNQADTYGLLIRIDRKDIINDDLSALSRVPARLGRSGALKFNEVFWTTFLDDAAFFNTDKSKGNYVDGTASALSIGGLTLAETAFLDQTGPDDKPLGLTPAVLLVPNALNSLAKQLMGSLNLITGENATTGEMNPFSGSFRPVRSSYLTAAKVWYLIANPADLPVIEAAFLNGRQEPTVETASADFNTLGIQMRGYFDFGVARQEYRAGVKVKGEN